MTPATPAAVAVEGPSPPPVRHSRLAWVDAARGIALVAMFAYHFSWDLAFFGFIGPEVPVSPPFRAYAHLVASAFLLLVGVGLVLADRGGLRWRTYWRRLAAVAGAAAAITLATLYLFPDSYIFFGILHCIAVASVLALPFLRAPLWLVAGVAVLCAAAPFLAAPVLDAPPFWWLGLGTRVPASNDYRPLFPWFAVVLAGIALARLAPAWWAATAGWAPRSWPGRLLVLGGRHSLLVYLVHQPILIGLLFCVAHLRAHPAGDGVAFVRACFERCVGEQAAPSTCSSACSCLAKELEAEGLWQDAVGNRLSADQGDQVRRIGLACGRAAPHPNASPSP